MKKRIVCLMATCLLGVSLLAGCGSSNDTTGADASSQDQASEDTGNTTIDKLNVTEKEYIQTVRGVGYRFVIPEE